MRSLEDKSISVWRVTGLTVYQRAAVSVYDFVWLLSEYPWVRKVVLRRGARRQLGNKYEKVVSALEKLGIEVVVRE
jgi:hypothetical protein